MRWKLALLVVTFHFFLALRTFLAAFGMILRPMSALLINTLRANKESTTHV